ncbi:MAG: diguanylate cyclase [Syntrophales bacterium]
MQDKNKNHLIKELAEIRQQLAEKQKLAAKRQRVEGALRESQQLLRLVLDAIPVRIFWKDRELNYLGCNQMFASDAGLDSPEAIVGRSDYDMGWKDQANLYRADDHAVISSGTPRLHYEEPQTTPEGGLIWLRTSKIPILDAEGEIKGVLGTYEDITERKQAENDLKESQRHFADIINFLPDATFVIDKEGKVTSWNRAIEEITGVPAEDILGKGNYEHALPFYGQRRPMLANLILLPNEEVESQYSFIHREKDMLLAETHVPSLRGTERFLSGRAAPIYNIQGEIVGAIESFRDLTEQKLLEKSLTEEHLRISTIMDGSPVSTFVIDSDRHVIVWNLVNEFFTGIAKKDILGKPINLDRLFKDRVRASLAEIILDMTDDDVLKRYAIKGVHKSEIHPEAFETIDSIWVNEEEHILAIQATRVRDAQGNVTGAIQCAEDITARKRAEEELQKAKDKLEQWVDELEQRNREMNLLRQMGDLLNTCDAFNEAYTVIKQFVPLIFPSTAGALYAFSESRRAVESVVVWGDRLYSDHVFPPEDCWALRRGQLHLVNPDDPKLQCRHVDVSIDKEYLGVPMMAAGEIMGLLHMEFGNNLRCNQREQELALIVAEHLALSLSNLKLRETLRDQSIRDPLTGLFNRRYMEESLEREIHRAVRKQSKLTIMMLDIDHFKTFNDTYGHETGDDLLREFGIMIRKHTRVSDIACRFGGEEFIFILPEATLEIAEKRAEQIRTATTFLKVIGNREHTPTTVSIGIAAFPDHGKSMVELLRMSDEALYQAKNKGRNRVEIAI